MIVTWNVRHFPASGLAMYHISVLDPDSFLSGLHDRDPETMAAVVDAARANLRRSEPTFEDYLQAVQKQGLTTFVSRVRANTK